MRCGDAPQADWLPRRTEVFRMAFCHETYPPFEVTVQRDDAVATVVVSGELDLDTVPRLSATITEHGDATLLVLDQVLDLCELDGRLAVVTDHPSPAARRVAVIDTGPMAPPPPKLIPGAG